MNRIIDAVRAVDLLIWALVLMVSRAIDLITFSVRTTIMNY